MISLPNLSDFSFGELSPRFQGQPANPIYRKGGLSFVNFRPRRQGGFDKCPGTLVQGHTATDASARVMKWVINQNTRYVVEFTNNLIRFWKWSSGALTYLTGQDIVSTYLTAELNAMQFAWSYPYMFIAHPNHAPYMMTWASGDTFTGKDIVFSGANVQHFTGTISLTTTVTLTVGSLNPDISGGATYNNYVGKAITGAGIPKNTTISSVSSSTVFAISNASTNGSGIALTISDPYLSGQTPALPFQTSGNFPSVVATAFQRLFFANTNNDPLGFWGSVVGFFDSEGNVQMGTYETVTYQSPQMNLDANGQPTTQPPSYTTTTLSEDIVGDADGMYFDINSDKNDQIQWIAPDVDLFIGTANGLWVMPAQATANNVSVTVVSRIGSDQIQGAMVEGGCTFVTPYGRRVGQIGWQGIYNPWVPPDDLTFYAEHLFNKKTVVMWDFQQNPETMLWFLTSDGYIVALLMDTAHGVRAWWHRTTTGTITSLTVIPGDDRDIVVISVTRNGYNLVEILDNDNWYDTTQSNNGEVNANYLDSAVTKSSGVAFTSVTGLAHLDGLVVGMVGDGAYLGTATVSGGSVTLPVASKVAHVGLMFTATFQSMPLDMSDGQQATIGLPKSTVLAYMRFYNTLDCEVGLDTNNLSACPLGGVNATLANPAMFSGDEMEDIANETRSPAYVVVQSSLPLPCTVSALDPQVQTG